jgi:hypothetical protein
VAQNSLAILHPTTLAAGDVLGAGMATTWFPDLVDSNIPHILWELKLPYLENVQTETLAQLMVDHSEELGRFRHALLLAYAEASRLTDSSNPSKIASQIQNEVIDNGVNELEKIAAKLEKRRWFRRVGCFISSISLEIVGFTAGSVFPGIGLVPPFITWAWEAVEKGAFERLPMHFLWRLRGKQEKYSPQSYLRYWKVPWLFDSLASTGYFGDNVSHGLVCVTSGGKRYHHPGCRYAAYSPIVMRIGLAEDNGYKPCSRCMKKHAKGKR